MRRRVLAGLAGALVSVWGLSGVYQVGPDERGMVTRFGAFTGETGPGLHYHLPAPIEAVRLLPVGSVSRLDLSSNGEGVAPGPMLTRDGQLAEVSFSLGWRISDPYTFLYLNAAPQAALRQDAEAAVRRSVAEASFTDLTAAARTTVAARALGLLQAALRRDDLGVSVAGLQISDVEPPAAAQAGLHDVAAARAEAESAARDVGGYRDRVLAAAHAEAAKAVQASQAARDQEISGAKGEAERFALVDAQYRKAPDVTRERLYTEMMERVLHDTRKIIVQTPKGFSGQIVLPPELFRAKPAETPPQSPPAQAQPQSQGGQASASDAPSGPTA